jgi:pyruvate dehydrogenase E1 component alpha subunit/2-oxoisovalerate dehydrogenase E1 component
MPRESVAQFTVESVQVLAEDGSVDEDLVPSLTDD